MISWGWERRRRNKKNPIFMNEASGRHASLASSPPQALHPSLQDRGTVEPKIPISGCTPCYELEAFDLWS